MPDGKLSMKKILILKGNIIFAESNRKLTTLENGYIISEDGIVVGVFEQLPEKYQSKKVSDFGSSIIIPGLVDLHLHAPQFASRGMGMDLELIPWLNNYAFKEEAKFSDLDYATKVYSSFCAALKNSATTRASVFASLHLPATEILMQKLEESGLVTYVGKVNMDRNSPEYLVENTSDSVSVTEEWIRCSKDSYKNTRPIITPRFVPSCSEKLMMELGKLAVKYHIPVQSHLSENQNEIKWVKELHPAFKTYSDVYNHFSLLGQEPTIMAHCVYLTENELDLIHDHGVYVAHCPQSNINISSGIAPVRQMIEKGIRVGLGTDIAGGFSISIFRAITNAIQVSKMYSLLIDQNKQPLTLPEAFYMATKGGGSFWGNVGSFEPGFELDAVVIDDTDINALSPLSLSQRLERVVYLSEDRHIKAKFARGEMVRCFQP